MNINVLLGIISFVIWSVFSTWYYVNFIKDFSSINTELAVASVPPPIEEPKADVKPDTVIVKKAPPIEISREFRFEKNTATPIRSAKISSLIDSISNATSESLYVTIIGYTCDLGTEKYNNELGTRRSESIEALFKESSLQAEYTLASKGESEPKVPNTSEENREKNRRVSLIIKSKQ